MPGPRGPARTAGTGSSFDRLPSVVQHYRLLDGVRGGQNQLQPQVHQVHVRDRQHDVAADHDASSDQPVNQVDECDVLVASHVASHLVDGHHAPPTEVLSGTCAKLYGGQGPVISSAMPSAARSAFNCSASETKSSNRPRANRYAALRSIGSCLPDRAAFCGGVTVLRVEL